MGLTVSRQTVKKVTVNRQKWIVLTVNSQLDQALLAVKCLILRSIIALSVKSTVSLYMPKYTYLRELFLSFSFILIITSIITIVRDSQDFRLETLPVSENVPYLLI